MAHNEIKLEKFVLILRTRAPMIMSIIFGAVIIAAILTYLTPKLYTANTSLNFEFSAGPVDNQGSSEYARSSYITTQIDIMKSYYVAQKVENTLSEYERQRVIDAFRANRSIITDFIGLIKSPILKLFADDKSDLDQVMRKQTKTSSEKLEVDSGYGWLARAMNYGLAVEPLFNSRIVEVNYSSTDPEVATLLANRFSEVYINTNLEMVTDPARKSKVWFDEQLKSLRANLEKTQSDLTAYQQDNRIISSDERMDTETSRLRNLSSQLVQAQQDMRNAMTSKQKLKEVFDSGASLMTFEPVFNNSVVQRLKTEIRNLESERVEQSASLGKNHPRMKKLNSEIYAAKQRLNKEIEDVIDGISNATALSREREDDLAQAVDEQKQVVLNLKNHRDRIAILTREVESAQATYNATLKQVNTTSMQSMVDQTNVAIIDRANVPSSHSSPRVMKNLALAAFIGFTLGVGLAVFREIFIRRVYSQEDFTAELGVPLLGHLKKVNTAT